MQFTERKQLTDNIDRLAKYNAYNQNYSAYPYSDVDMEKVKYDFELLRHFAQNYEQNHKPDIPSVGDCLLLPDNQVVYFCSVYDDRAQTCESGSFHLSNGGYISYSGGLDIGLKLDNIELTEDLYVLPIWFSHRGVLCGGCAIYASISCRVWKTKAGADLTGIPQIRRLKRQKLKEQSETITKYDSLGKPYLEHLPEIIIKKANLPDGLIESIIEQTGLAFEDSYYTVPIYWCQPMQLIQIDLLKSFKQFTFTEDRNYSNHAPMLVLFIDKDKR